MVQRVITQRKLDYRARLEKYLREYQNILIVNVDMVGSNQMQQVRIALRGRAVVLMGKNTIMRKVIREMLEENPKLEQIIPHIFGNIGFVFTNEDLSAMRSSIVEHKVPAAARPGAIAPSDVVVPAGPTGLDPGQTAFFQALNIATKIVKGTIEIIADVPLIHKGEKVTPSAVSLLSKLDIKPFFFGITVLQVYENGSLYDASILDLKEEDMLARFLRGVQLVTQLSLGAGLPNLATLPHSFARVLKKLVAIAVETEITFKEAEPFKEFLADPAAFAAKHGGGAVEEKSESKAAVKEEPKKVEEEEEEGEMGFSLFGDD